MFMASKSMRVLNIVSGVLLIAVGIYCLCNQDIAAATAGFMVGIFMLVSGIIEIVVFAVTSGLLFGSGWLLLDGVLTVILSLFLLFNQWFTIATVTVYTLAFVLRYFSVRQCIRFESAWRSQLGMGFSRWYCSDDCRVYLYDGSFGQHNGCRYDSRTCVSA